jgi:hypothetical protein
MSKLLEIIAAAIGLGSPTPVDHQPYQHAEAAIVRVDCDKWRGSATRVGPTTYISVAHVMSGTGCKVGGEGTKVTYINEKQDFAVFEGKYGKEVIQISCDGYRYKEPYIMRGYAGGGEDNFFQPVIFVAKWAGFATFVGEDFPGMSGGPVIDVKGRITGTVNIGNPTGSVDLKDTVICRSK